MVSQGIHVLAAVLCLTAVLTGGQAQCQTGETPVVTIFTCNTTGGGIVIQCVGEGTNVVPENVVSVEPLSASINGDVCFYGITTFALAFSDLESTCRVKVTSCKPDQGTGGAGGGVGPCQADETELVTNATCVRIIEDERSCLGDGGSELPGTVRSFQPVVIDGEACFYRILSPTQLLAFSDGETCTVKVTSCIAVPGKCGSIDSHDDDSDSDDEDDDDDDDDSNES
ncbi:uncharacterized protein LOC135477246 [Liolophura sinensis]|uniref:uncharacterized protein LOC135477246 n=1 Tax=Liolophura sinensis TaxID=3198878 RepID=UPI0031597DDA